MNAYIIAGYRSAVGKAPRGKFRFTRPDDLAAKVIQHLMSTVPNLAREQVDDVIVGNATPEAEQGLNIGRMISLMGLNTDKVPGMTVNRYCSSGSGGAFRLQFPRNRGNWERAQVAMAGTDEQEGWLAYISSIDQVHLAYIGRIIDVMNHGSPCLSAR